MSHSLTHFKNRYRSLFHKTYMLQSIWKKKKSLISKTHFLQHRYQHDFYMRGHFARTFTNSGALKSSTEQTFQYVAPRFKMLGLREFDLIEDKHLLTMSIMISAWLLYILNVVVKANDSDNRSESRWGCILVVLKKIGLVLALRVLTTVNGIPSGKKAFWSDVVKLLE